MRSKLTHLAARSVNLFTVGMRSVGANDVSWGMNLDCGSWAEARAGPDPGGFTPESGLPTACPTFLPWVPSSVSLWHFFVLRDRGLNRVGSVIASADFSRHRVHRGGHPKSLTKPERVSCLFDAASLEPLVQKCRPLGQNGGIRQCRFRRGLPARISSLAG
jgi:hypothetical protein